MEPTAIARRFTGWSVASMPWKNSVPINITPAEIPLR
jgi:hypothetical protein